VDGGQGRENRRRRELSPERVHDQGLLDSAKAAPAPVFIQGEAEETERFERSPGLGGFLMFCVDT
jgi:hypothetical protein